MERGGLAERYPDSYAKTVLHEGDRVRLVWDESSDIVPADIPLDILY